MADKDEEHGKPPTTGEIWNPIFGKRASDEFWDASGQSIPGPTNAGISNPLHSQPTVDPNPAPSGNVVYPVARRPSSTMTSGECNPSRHWVQPYECAKCKAGFLRQSDLDSHRPFCVGREPFQSDTHLKNITSEADPGIDLQANLGPRPSEGSSRGEEFSLRSGIQPHQFQVQTQKEFPCCFCPETFISLDLFRQHLIANHTTGNKCKCDICTKEFYTQGQVREHRRVVHTAKRFLCPVCSCTFSTKALLEVHIRTHSGERPFRCEFCLKKFRQRSSLNRHIKSHDDEREFFQCEICLREFAQKCELTRHLRVHAAEGALYHQCDICQEVYARRRNLKRHLEFHAQK